MASLEKKERDAAVEHFKRMVEVAVSLGTNTVNTVSVFPFAIEVPRITDRPHMQEFSVDYPSGLDWKQNREDYVDAVRRCCDICEDAKVRLLELQNSIVVTQRFTPRRELHELYSQLTARLYQVVQCLAEPISP